VLSLGLIGCGAVAHVNYAATLVGRQDYEVGYVFDLDSEQARSAARVFGAQVVDLPELLDRADGVIVATPPASHAELVGRALRPGRPVFCEKPFMVTGDDARALVAKAEATPAPLYVGHFRRVFPQLELAREMITAGVLGEITAFSASEGGRFTWDAVSRYTTENALGGVLWDTGSHTLDMVLYATGIDEADSVSVAELSVDRDKPEPSHDLAARFALDVDGAQVRARLHVSRTRVLPNTVVIESTRGRLAFVCGLDDRVRLTTATGTVVMKSARGEKDILGSVDLHFRKIFIEGDDRFGARRFVHLVSVLEALGAA
jgi:predicted dehydrogenase